MIFKLRTAMAVATSELLGVVLIPNKRNFSAFITTMTNLTAHIREKHRNATPAETGAVSVDSTPVIDTDLPARPGTPTIRRTAGIRLPHDQSAMDLIELHELLDIDLRSSPDTYIDGVEIISEDRGIFPDSKLPIKPTKNLLDRLSHFDASLRKWIIPDECYTRKKNPDGSLSSSETPLANFLNNICEDIRTLTGKEPTRHWSSHYCNTPLEGSPITRKPDILLIDINKRTPTTWSSVRSIAEITTQDSEPKRVANTVTDKSYVILTTQPNRVFVPMLSFWGKFNLRLTVTDRQGQLRSQVLKLGENWRLPDSLNFLRLLIGLCFADKPTIGYDPTMLTDEWDKVVFIICEGRKFKIVNCIFESQSLVGRATRVWVVEFQNRKYILKDAWVEVSRPVPEYDILNGLKGIKGISQLFCGGDVCVDGTILSTGLIRNNLWGDQNRIRNRRRTVTSSIGAHIASFGSKRELISALRDITISM
jgi:hypothetical protein